MSILAEGTLPDGQWKWHGGLASDDGTKIIGFPNNAGKFAPIKLIILTPQDLISCVMCQADSILIIGEL